MMIPDRRSPEERRRRPGQTKGQAPGLSRPCSGRAVAVALVLPLAATLLFGLPSASRAEDDSPKKPDAQPTPTPGRPAPPLRFTDEDLQKYHRPVPAEDEGGEGAGAPAAGAPGAAAPAQKPAVKPAAPRTPPPGDPLKPYHDRDAMEKFRNEQIQALREKIAQAQSRLAYLKAKKDALETPPTLMQQGRTVRPAKPDIAPGTIFPSDPRAGKVAGIFPPIPPPQTDEDREKDKSLKPKELLEQTTEEIGKAEEELDGLKKELALAETHLQRETAPR